jgi:hypothetical protein
MGGWRMLSAYVLHFQLIASTPPTELRRGPRRAVLARVMSRDLQKLLIAQKGQTATRIAGTRT